MATTFKFVVMTVLASLSVGCAYDASYPYSSYDYYYGSGHGSHHYGHSEYGNGYRNGYYTSGYPQYGGYNRGYGRYCPDDD